MESNKKESKVKVLTTKAKTSFKEFAGDWDKMRCKHPVGTAALEAGGMLYVLEAGALVFMLATGRKLYFEIVKIK